MKLIRYAMPLALAVMISGGLQAQAKKTAPKKVATKEVKAVKETPKPVSADPAFMLKGFAPSFADSIKLMVVSLNRKDFVGPSGIIQNGQFLLTGALPEPGVYNMVLSYPDQTQPDRSFSLFLDNEPSAIRLTGEGANFEVIEGKSMKAFSDLMQNFSGSFDALNKLQQARQTTPQGSPAADSIATQWQVVLQDIRNKVPGFVKMHNTTAVAPFLLCILYPVTSDNIKEVESWVGMIDESGMNNDFGKSIRDNIANASFLADGTEAPVFVQNDTEGKPVDLKKFRGKYVLLDFWASWCGPCRRENPNVVNAYNKYKTKNFTVLGISLDKDKDRWLQAIAADGLTWTHVSDLGYWSNAVAQLYKVQSIPQNFLLDPQGKIVGKNLRGEELDNFLENVLSKK